MFEKMVVNKIVKSTQVVVVELARALRREGFSEPEIERIWVATKNGLQLSAVKLGTETANAAVSTIMPRLRAWFGLR
jgi:hypothetical protein